MSISCRSLLKSLLQECSSIITNARLLTATEAGGQEGVSDPDSDLSSPELVEGTYFGQDEPRVPRRPV